MSGFQVKTIEENKSYPLGRFQSLNKMEMDFWQKERVRQNTMLEQVKYVNTDLNFPLNKDVANMHEASQKVRSTLYNVKDADLLTRYSDAREEIPNETNYKIKALGNLRAQNQFLGHYLNNFDELSADMNITFKDDAHKKQVKDQLNDFYNKRDDTIKLMKDSISKEMDMQGIPPFDQKGRNLTVPDSYDAARKNSIKEACAEQGKEHLSEVEAEKAAKQMVGEIKENIKKMEEYEKNYAVVQEELKETVEKRRKVMEKYEADLEQKRLDQQATEFEKEEMWKKTQEICDECDKEIEEFKQKKEEIANNISNLQVSNQMMNSELDIIKNNQSYNDKNASSVEISVSDLSGDGKPKPKESMSFFDSVAKFLSTAWAELMSHFEPLSPTASPKAMENEPVAKQPEKQQEPLQMGNLTKNK